MIERELSQKLRYIVKKMPVISITGPRQSGKSTLVKHVFSGYTYVSLEHPQHRNHALNDPQDFLKHYGTPLIIDEAQYMPELFSYVQVSVDESGKMGEFILTGSQNFLLLKKITQSLAGRVAIYNLLPFSITELKNTQYKNDSFEENICKGFYPPVYHRNISQEDWFPFYISSYIEREIRQIINIKDLNVFQRFIALCAGRTGQLLNLSELGNELAVSYHTVRNWLSILEAGFIVFLLPPYFKSFNKRMIKSPKLYFYDTGLACHLLRINSAKELYNSFFKGHLFENLVIADIMKNILNKGKRPQLYFWRDNTGNEIDCIIEDGTIIKPIEIKSGRTIHEEFFKGLNYFNKLSKGNPEHSYLVYGGDENYKRSYANVFSWKNLASITS